MHILILDGDGIGPEVNAQALAVLDWARAQGLAVTIERALVGGAAIDAEGAPVSDATVQKAKAADAILFGAVGGPQWEGLPRALRPEQGLLRLRRALGLFANLRPAKVWPGLEDVSPLRPERAAGTDLVFVRELTGGVYFGEPRGQKGSPPDRRALDSQVYTEAEIARAAHAAFRLARGRRGHVTSVEKANVMETGQLWRAVASEVAAHYPDVTLAHMFADNCAFQLVRAPAQFDVILTDNLFGDLLSDLAGGVAGSLGLLPSASLGEGPEGRTPGLYEPVHGSAPDIAGQGKANPVAAILSLAMALRHSLGAPALAGRVEAAVGEALAGGARTPDLGGSATTAEVGAAVLAALAR
jgi:3-isopropylmalate dehydrogenase